MITWREEGEMVVGGHTALLGENEIGLVFQFYSSEWRWEIYLGSSFPVSGAPTLPAAKQALERAVAEWVKRAELVKGDGWKPIDSAPHDDGWISPCLFGKQQKWGWETWVGQRDAWDIWLGREGDGCCFDCEIPTHWRPLPSPPVRSER